MCWIEKQEKVDIQIADRDIEVYKIVHEASKQSCKSSIRDFIYESNTIYKIPSIQTSKTCICSSVVLCVNKAYHSYTKVKFTHRYIGEKDYPHKYKAIIAGDQLYAIETDNSCYIANFVIPKGSQYAINWKGEIISNQIMYTGKHFKL